MSVENNHQQFISFRDIAMAYRKAKVDAFYSSYSMRASFLTFEKNLIRNLQKFERQLHKKPLDIDLGTWAIVPKAITIEHKPITIIHTDPIKHWENICAREKPYAEFRLMAKPSVEFFLLSAIWIDKVGHRYDAMLSGCASGNRLRRKKNGDINPFSLGAFQPYMKPFRNWRDGALIAMQSAIENGKKILALTADVTSFYHELNPDFMIDDRFLNTINLKLNNEERELTVTFVKSLKKWAKNTPLKKGLPVGLPASSIIANLALFELDCLVKREMNPLYYGRYVDDIILVMENNMDFKSSVEVWEWIFKRSKSLLRWQNRKEESISFIPSYLEKSKIHFSNKKGKVFLLEASGGLALVNSILRQINNRASEWRALPSLPKNSAHIPAELLYATQRDGESADNLYKTDSISLRRAGFAIRLRDFEAYARDLPPEVWQKHRHVFFDAVIQHVFVLPVFFDLSIYMSRILIIATACADFEHLRRMIDRLDGIIKSLRDKCHTTIKACPDLDCPSHEDIIKKWQSNLQESINESIQAAFPLRLTNEAKTIWQRLFSNDQASTKKIGFDTSIKSLQSTQFDLFMHDLADLPFRYIGLPREVIGCRAIPPKKETKCLLAEELKLDNLIIHGVDILKRWMKIPPRIGLPYGLLFSTRPFSVQELYLLQNKPFSFATQEAFCKVILAIRGFNVEGKMPFTEKNGLIDIPIHFEHTNRKIALTSWKTEHTSWCASVMRKTDPDFGRYQRINSLVNDILRSPAKPDYVIFPELSMPAVWFVPIARKLQGKGISMISGIEYLHRRGKRVSNQVWAALSHNSHGFLSWAIVRQDKQHPSMHEEQELFKLAGLKLVSQVNWGPLSGPPVICHGNMQFAMLICSELTNISYRAALRGVIDALFVPEWNKDTETFNTLVESAAIDIHTFVIQCNDRKYGDSRIRAPYKESWRRDLVRIKGGIEDYFVVGEIDIASLRAFQSSYRSFEDPFKPVPDGFKIASNRIQLPMTKEKA